MPATVDDLVQRALAAFDALAATAEPVADEAGGIADPHRAIDWLSTLPQVALAALGEPA